MLEIQKCRLISLFKTLIFQFLVNSFQATLRRALVPPVRHPGTSLEIRYGTCGTSYYEPGVVYYTHTHTHMFTHTHTHTYIYIYTYMSFNFSGFEPVELATSGLE